MSALALAAALSTTSLSIALQVSNLCHLCPRSSPNGIQTIAQDFHLSTPNTFWLGTSTALTSTIIQPCCATLADVFGRKAALTGSALLLTVGSLMGAVAPNYATILAARTLQGFGSGGISALTDIIVTDIVPLRVRGKWFAFISVPWAIGTTVGPVLSGIITTEGSWRWIFAINVIASTSATLACWFALPPLPSTQQCLSELLQVDIFGFLLLTLSLIAVMVPIMQASVVYSWRDAHTLVPLVLGVLGLCLFLVYEQRWAHNPLIPLKQFQNRSCMLTFFCTMLHGMVLWCIMYYLPVYYETIKGFSSLDSGLAVLPETLTLVPASILIGYLVSWTGKYRWAIWMGWAISTMGSAILYLLTPSTPKGLWIVLNLPVGVGMGLLFGAMGFAVQAAVDAERVSLAVTLYSFWRSFGAVSFCSQGVYLLHACFI
ncbi:major facilitator superfamily domain-containing protein [Talaromyces proteolyticus]|uniref:Major facilitator superfamily domain-containing protein n=1 Tax=Talaromyces proteolyticus TaxID=1131652 RepID=A0AAD4KZU6_9EURO|nr:major facilitator superfamily domain-containing protein [Talaromyces proteolyticus]KAH8704942.1 major facilitator superfamily domain-containing protein [Talaromyces proteolyticus]